MPHHTRVLVVDDEPLLREVVADALREARFEVQTAANGLDAFERLSVWVPDVIVLDLMMPRLDGRGFAALLRLNPRFAHIPMLLVTAAYGVHDAQRVGASDLLTKPFELDQLVARVQHLAGMPRPTPAV